MREARANGSRPRPLVARRGAPEGCEEEHVVRAAARARGGVRARLVEQVHEHEPRHDGRAGVLVSALVTVIDRASASSYSCPCPYLEPGARPRSPRGLRSPRSLRSPGSPRSLGSPRTPRSPRTPTASSPAEPAQPLSLATRPLPPSLTAGSSTSTRATSRAPARRAGARGTRGTCIPSRPSP